MPPIRSAVGGSTIEPRILTSPSDDEKEPMARSGDVKTLQKFAAVHASIHNHFNQYRHLNRRDIFKQNRSIALAEWRQLAAWDLPISGLCGPVRVCLTVPFFAIPTFFQGSNSNIPLGPIIGVRSKTR